jgi:hypothetical protein
VQQQTDGQQKGQQSNIGLKFCYKTAVKIFSGAAEKSVFVVLYLDMGLGCFQAACLVFVQLTVF